MKLISPEVTFASSEAQKFKCFPPLDLLTQKVTWPSRIFKAELKAKIETFSLFCAVVINLARSSPYVRVVGAAVSWRARAGCGDLRNERSRSRSLTRSKNSWLTAAKSIPERGFASSCFWCTRACSFGSSARFRCLATTYKRAVCLF